MTESTFEREQATGIVKVVLMIIALAISGLMLSKAIQYRLDVAGLDPVSQITTEVRERQLACLAKNIYYEAGSEPFEGKVAVAQVTINRTESGVFPGDICKTIFQKNVVYEKVICQFSWACDRDTGVRPLQTANYNESMTVAKKVLLEGFRLPSLKNALYYHADYINPGWHKPQVAHIGHHIFYN
jgi:spore germination cell wall hydrolase CwlJ-like protein